MALVRLCFKHESFDEIDSPNAFVNRIFVRLVRLRFVEHNDCPINSRMTNKLIKMIDVQDIEYIEKAESIFKDIYDKSVEEIKSNKGFENEYEYEMYHSRLENVDTEETEEKEERDATKRMIFEQCFVKKFVLETSDKKEDENGKLGLQPLLKNIFIQIGVFWKIVNEMQKCFKESKQSDELKEMIEKYSQLGMINVCIVNDHLQSLFHIATAYDMSDTFDLLIELDNNVTKYKDIYGLVKSIFAFVFVWP